MFGVAPKDEREDEGRREDDVGEREQAFALAFGESLVAFVDQRIGKCDSWISLDFSPANILPSDAKN